MKKYILIFLLMCLPLFAQSNINEDSLHFIGQASAFTVGANLVTNGDFSEAGVGGAESTTVFADWSNSTFAAEGSDPGGNSGTEVQNVDPGEFHDDAAATGGACNLWNESGNAIAFILQNSILTIGKTYKLTCDVAVNNIGVSFTNNGLTAYQDFSTDGKKVAYFIATDEGIGFKRLSAGTDVTIDNVSVVEWTGDPDAGGGCTIATFSGDLSDYMGAAGEVLAHEEITALSDDGGALKFTSAGTWDKDPVIGTNVNVLFDAPLTFIDSGIFTIIGASSSTITIGGLSEGFAGRAAEIWIGGAFPDIATAVNDSTLSQDLNSFYRKRHICVNVPMVVDAVTDFVAETSETSLREDDGSRKIIGFNDSISVVQPGEGGDTGTYGYRVVSDMDEGQTYYGGAWQAFKSDEGFSDIRPDGKWIEWDASGNSINILELNISNFEMRNIKIHNTAIGGTNALLHVDDASVFNHAFVNCWFATADFLILDDKAVVESNFNDCYFDNSIITTSLTLTRLTHSMFVNCIGNGKGKPWVFDGNTQNNWTKCLFYKGQRTLRAAEGSVYINCIHFDQTVSSITGSTNTSRFTIINSILSPAVAASDIAIEFTSSGGSLNPASRNNIMYSVTAGAVLTNPISHSQISPNPPLPVGTLEVDPLFVNPDDGDFRLQNGSPALNAGMRTLFNGYTSIGTWQRISRIRR